MVQKIPKLLLLFIFTTSVAFSRQENGLNYFSVAIQKKARSYKHEINFNKAQYFFLKKEWDSTLVYSMKQLNSKSDLEIKEYCHFFRGYSLKEKGLYKQSHIEFNLINKSFQYYYLVDNYTGGLFYFEKKFEQAIIHFLKAEKEILNQNDNSEIIDLYANIGICYLHLKQFTKAESYLKKEVLLNPKQITKSIIQSNTNIANLYYLQYKDQQAIYYFTKAYTLSKNIKNFNLKENTAFNMAVVEENRGNYKKAIDYRKEAEDWKDSLNNQNKIWAVADFEKKFAVAQKQKQIKVLEVENKLKDTQRNSLFFCRNRLTINFNGRSLSIRSKSKKCKNHFTSKEQT